MENVVINEPVDVGAVFSGNRIRPKWFIWNSRKYQIKEITYTWRDKKGQARIIHFSVTDGATLFELSLNQNSLSWCLEQVSIE